MRVIVVRCGKYKADRPAFRKSVAAPLLHGHHVDTHELLAGQEFEGVLDDMRAAMEREVPCQPKNPRDSFFKNF